MLGIMREKLKNLYLYCETIPDRLYPFKVEIEGQLVRGQQAYMKTLADAWEKYGAYNMGYKLTVYRGAFHFVGSLWFIVCAAVLSHRFLDSEIALYVLMGAAIAALFYQEFFIHPRQYNQKSRKGISDWLTWVIPMMVYLTFIN